MTGGWSATNMALVLEKTDHVTRDIRVSVVLSRLSLPQPAVRLHATRADRLPGGGH